MNNSLELITDPPATTCAISPESTRFQAVNIERNSVSPKIFPRTDERIGDHRLRGDQK
jgi:hypothetical protein